jgi:hypothetical protein
MNGETISPLRRRMIEDMKVRKFVAKTQTDYIRHVKGFTIFRGRSPDTATAEDLRRYQLHLTENGVRAPSVNSAVSALRFFFSITLDRLAAGDRPALEVADIFRDFGAAWRRANAGHVSLGQLKVMDGLCHGNSTDARSCSRQIETRRPSSLAANGASPRSGRGAVFGGRSDGAEH